MGSTEVGQSAEIKPTFSTCFGAPFFPRYPSVYAELLMKRLRNHKASVYLVNTGWTGGALNEGGHRFSIPTTRSIVSSIVTRQLENVAYEKLPGFNLEIPKEVQGIDNQLLNPTINWQDKEAYKSTAKKLIQQFINNFARFKVSEAINQAGPTLDWE